MKSPKSPKLAPVSLASVVLSILAIFPPPLFAQTCPQPFTLRQESCPGGASTCSSKGSTLTYQELDRDILNAIGLCNGPGQFIWPVPSAGTLTSDSSGNITITAGMGSGTVTNVATGAGLTGGPITTTGTVALDYSSTLASNSLSANQCLFGSTGVLCEGATSNGFETLVTSADPTTDRTITLPNSTGTVALLSDLSYVHAQTYGAIPDDANDDLSAIQSAMAALPSSGGTVYLPCGILRINATLSIGDGSAAAQSTLHNIRLRGCGSAVSATTMMTLGGASGTRIEWRGSAGDTMIEFKGPMSGGGMEGITLIGDATANIAATLLKTFHQANATFEDVAMFGYSDTALRIDAVGSAGLPSGVVLGGDDVKWERVYVGRPSNTSGIALDFGATSAGGAATDNARHTFTNCWFAGGTGSAGRGAIFRFIDNIDFIGVHFSAGTSTTAVEVIPPTGNTSFPGGITMFHGMITGNFAVTGTWTPTWGIVVLPLHVETGTAPNIANISGLELNDLFGVDVDFERGTESFPRLGQSTAPPSTDCDAAGEEGRLYWDTDAPTGQRLKGCEGTGGWVTQGDGTVATSGDSATAFFPAGQIEPARGGTGADSSGSTGVPRVSSGVWTFDAKLNHLSTSTSADLAGVLSDETGTGAFVLQTSPAIAGMPTFTGSPFIGDGAGNDSLNFWEEAGNPACAAGDYRIWANSTDTKLKKCTNGTIADLDTGEANTASNLGGQLANFSAKVGVDLQFNTFWANDFDLVSNVFGIDDTKWATDAQATTAGTTAVNAAGGRSLTCGSGSCDADAELYEFTKCMTIETPVSGDDFLLTRMERAATITGIDCLSVGGTSVAVLVKECDANGGTCGNTEASITCATTNSTEASGIDDSAVDAGDWLRVDPGTVTGSVTQLAVCVTYQTAD